MSGSVIFFCLFAKGIGRPGGREKRSENLRVFTFPVRSFSPIFFLPLFFGTVRNVSGAFETSLESDADEGEVWV